MKSAQHTHLPSKQLLSKSLSIDLVESQDEEEL